MTQKRTKTLFSNRITQIGLGLLPFVAGLALIPSAPFQVKADTLSKATRFEQNNTTPQAMLLAKAERGQLLKVASLNVKLMPAGAAAARTLKVADLL